MEGEDSNLSESRQPSQNPSSTDFEMQSRPGSSNGEELPKVELSDMPKLPPVPDDGTNPFVKVIDRQSGLKMEKTEEEDPSSCAETQRSNGNTQVIFTPHGFEFQPQVVTPGPNSVKVSPDDFVKTLAGFSNMYLAHEIAIDPDYKLERFKHPPDSIESRIEQQMKRAFWDVLDESLTSTPPNYHHALSIFEEMKTMLLSLLMPHHRSLKERINEVLDVELIKQQVQHEALDFKRYAEFIIDILSQLCAPSRDEEIAALRQLERPVELFRGILGVMENMKLDLANFYVQQFRPIVIQNCCSYEQKKFAEFLDLEYRLEEDGLRNARAWLWRHKLENLDKNVVIRKAFSEILTWSWDKQDWPETLSLDAERLVKVARTVKRLSIVGSVVLTAESIAQTKFQQSSLTVRNVLKEQLDSLITDDDVDSEAKLKECLCGVAEQVIKIVSDNLSAAKGRTLTEEEKAGYRQSIGDLGNPEHKIRSLLVRRTVEYAEALLAAERSAQIPVPSGLNCINPEVSIAIRSFCRLVKYNRTVFDKLYDSLLDVDPASDWSTVARNLQECIQGLASVPASSSTPSPKS